MVATARDEAFDHWRELLAVGLIADDLSPDTIARCTGVSRLDVLEAFTWARSFGILDDDDQISADEAARLVADLRIDLASRVHGELARHHLANGRESLEVALAHARQVTSAADTETVMTMCDRAGEMNLALADYASARALFETAEDLDLGDDDRRRGRRLLALAAAVDGGGDVKGARKLLERAGLLGERCGDVDLVVEAAVRHTLPTDWYAGDHRSLVLLARTERFDLNADQVVRIAAARSLAEIRIPVLPHDGQQLAWITRPELAQPLSEEALRDSVSVSDEARAMALLAWRSTHRGPRYLERRREVSRELLTVAERLRRPALQVDAAVFVAVDALEAGDRATFDRALGVSRWVAEHDGNPRLCWRADTLAAGAAHLDGHSEAALEFAQRAERTGQAINTPGWFAALMFFLAQRAIDSERPEEMQALLLDESHAGMSNPLAMAGVAYCHARCGGTEVARNLARGAIRKLDFESSPLLLMTRLSAVALVLEDVDLRREVLEVVTPWVEHVSVDGNGWWCDGPVSLWAALLHESLAERTAAHDLLEVARPQVTSLHDVRSRSRLDGLARRLSLVPSPTASHDLTDRELRVLAMLCAGATNPVMARELNYSLSTVRNDTMSIYRKLGVAGRAEAAAKAQSLGLVTDTTSVDGSTATNLQY